MFVSSFGEINTVIFTAVDHFGTGVDLNESSQMHLINDSPGY